MILSLMYTEWLKMKKSNVFALVWLSPILATVAGYFTSFELGVNQWLDAFLQMVLVHAVLFLPLLAGIFSAAVCRYEHDQGGWKQLLVMPVNRSKVYFSKLLIIVIFIAISQLLFLVGLLLVGWMQGYSDPFPWNLILTRLFMGWLACLPLVTLQLWVSTLWASFAAPIALNVIFTLPNIMVANSERFGPWYPWAQPFLGMLLGDEGDFFYSAETLLFVIIGGTLLFSIGGLTYFKSKEI